MGSGPVIITDDGGPPPLIQAIRVGRKGQKMGGLADVTKKTHNVNGAHQISRVHVTQDSNLSHMSYSPKSVKVIGASDLITTLSGETSAVSTKVELTPEPSSGWEVYRAASPKIESVQIDDATIITKGSLTRVEIYF